MRSPESGVSVRTVPVVLGAFGVILVLLCTSRYGVGLEPDSAQHLAAARSLLAGAGLRYYDGTMYTGWPPLFPALLALFGLASIEPQIAARFINAFAFGATVFVLGRLFLKCTMSNAFAVLGTLSIVLSAPLLAMSAMAMTEPVFILLATLFVLYIASFLQARRWTLLLVASILAALGCLERYTGVTLVVTGCLLIVLCAAGARLRERAKWVAVFIAISGTPLALWIVRNRMVTGEPVGGHRFHFGSAHEFHRAIVSGVDVITPWLFPKSVSATTQMIGPGLILLAASVAVILARCVFRGRYGAGSSLQIGSAVVYGLVYSVFMVICSAVMRWNLNERHLVPVYVVVMLLVFTGVADVSRLLSTLPMARLWGAWPGLLLCVLWLLYPFSEAGKCVESRVRDGAGVYSTPEWQESPLVCRLRANPLQGAVYTNVPEVMYLLLGTKAQYTPFWYWDTTQAAANMSSSEANYIVWFDNRHLDFLYDRRELVSRWRMEEIASFPDGGIYRFLGDGGPAVVGVHRFWNALKQRHHYTVDRSEIETINLYQRRQWRDEGAAFYVYSRDQHPADTLPVYQFWSATLDSRFYTIREEEKDNLIREYHSVWKYEGVAWYAYPEEQRPPEALPVYRFWSDALQTHFYTIDEKERDWLVQNYPQIWRCECVAWYAYGKE